MQNIANEHPAAWYDERIAYLRDFMTEERYDLFCRTLAARTDYVTLLAENTYHEQNAAALVRHAEAFGLQRLHTVEALCDFQVNTAIARGSERWIDVDHHRSTTEALAALRAEGYRIVATTPHHGDHTPDTFDVTAGRFALIFGTEKQGISEEVIATADEFLRIPMCGMVESLNVSASAAILLYELTTRLRRSEVDWHLSEAQQREILYRWMHLSINDSVSILNRRFGDPL